MSSVDEKLPEGWIETTLGELINVKHGYAFKGKYISETPNKNILVTPGNFSLGGGFKSEKFKYYHGEIPNDYKLNSNDVIVTMTDLSKEGDTLGFSALVPSNEDKLYLHNQRIGLVIFKNEKFDKQYAYWLLRTRHYQKSMVNSSTGSTVSHTSPSRIQEYNFNLPPLEEQKAIAKVLTAFDDKIENLRAQNQILEQTAQTIFKEWFGKYQIGDDLPEGWRVGKLGEVTKICGGTTPSTKNIDFWDGDIHWTSPKDLSNSKGMFLLSTEKKITKAGLKKISSGLLPKKTLLLSSRAPIGYLSFTNIELAINQGFIALLPKQYLSNEYMYLWLNRFMRVVENAGNGSTFLEISKTSFRNIDCIIPEEKILNRFSHFINPTFDKILSNAIQIQTLTQTRDALLPKLMRGEIRVNGFNNN